MSENKEYTFDLVKERGDEINKVSPTFCLAKWLQSTVLLYNGYTHSCHHPERHKIKEEDIKDNPSGLHNTRVKIQARQDMLRGIQTKECAYCWNIENLGKEHVSDRIYKSTYSWSFPRLDEVVRSGVGRNSVPSYLEIAFDSKCNARCLYCNPESSSSWEQEVKRFGPVPLSEGSLYDLQYMEQIGSRPIPQGDPNPYIDAFWKWWPILYKKLQYLRVTGGEPLMSPHTWRLMDLIEEAPESHLSFSINSNLCLPRAMIERLGKKINSLRPKIKAFEIYTSLESVGPQAEYVRYGMNYPEFLENCIYLLENTPRDVRLNFMTTINALSAPSFLGYLQLLRELRLKYTVAFHNFRVRTFFNYLRWPPLLSITMLPQDLKEKYREEWVTFVQANVITKAAYPEECFYEEELEQVKRLTDYMCSQKAPEKDYRDFRAFIRSIDERRSLDFQKTFPELAVFMNEDFYG